MTKQNIGIVIQARLGSSRLPGKIIKPFYKDTSVLDILLENLKKLGDFPIVLATSNSIKDEALKPIAAKHNILFYQGNEQDVLSRFLDVSDKYGFSTVIRICSDNPFLQMKFLKQLIQEFQENKLDYLSFHNGFNIPVIKTHFGLFGEIIKVKALRRVSELTSDKLYIEHVSNYIYTHPELFQISLIEVPEFLSKRTNLRFTLDDQQDFDLLKVLYNKYHNELHSSIEELVSFVDSKPDYLKMMVKNIEKHSK